MKHGDQWDEAAIDTDNDHRRRRSSTSTSQALTIAKTGMDGCIIPNAIGLRYLARQVRRAISTRGPNKEDCVRQFRPRPHMLPPGGPSISALNPKGARF